MTNFICRNCNYKFTKEITPKKCPYCSEATVRREESAEELLNEVDGMIDEGKA